MLIFTDFQEVVSGHEGQHMKTQGGLSLKANGLSINELVYEVNENRCIST